MLGLLGHFDRQNAVFKASLAVFLIHAFAHVKRAAAAATVAFLANQFTLLVLFFVLMALDRRHRQVAVLQLG